MGDDPFSLGFAIVGGLLQIAYELGVGFIKLGVPVIDLVGDLIRSAQSSNKKEDPAFSNIMGEDVSAKTRKDNVSKEPTMNPKNINQVLPVSPAPDNAKVITPPAPNKPEIKPEGKFEALFDNFGKKEAPKIDAPKKEVKLKKDNRDFDNPIFGNDSKEPKMDPKNINQVLPTTKNISENVEKIATPREKFLSGLDSLSKTAVAPEKSFQPLKLEQPTLTNEEQRKFLMDQADAKYRQELGLAKAPKIEAPTNEELRTQAIEAAHAKFLKNPPKEEKAPAPVISSVIAVESTITITPVERTASTQRLGLMNDPKKMDLLIEALNKHTPGGGWEKGNDGTSHNAQIRNDAGKNNFEVKNDSMITSDTKKETYEAMLVGFKAMYPDKKPTVTASPEQEGKWREAAKSAGVEINFKPAEPKATQAAKQTADGPSQTQEAAPTRPGMR